MIKPAIEAMIGVVKPLPDDDALRADLQAQIRNQEAFLIAVFAQALKEVPDAPAIDGPVNPLAVGLDPSKWEADGLFDGSGLTIEDARGLCPGLDAFWDPTAPVPSGPPPGLGGPPGAAGPPADAVVGRAAG